jgi:ElaA protein
MKTIIKSFAELTTTELYNILRLRSEVFVVEQNCVFLDQDNKDQKALHLQIVDDEGLVGYTRLYNKNQYFPETSIGRVVISPKHRDKKLGHLLMSESILAIETIFGETKIRIGAQCYLQKFYESQGFIVDGNIYVEDGIDHFEMIRQ